MPFFSVIVPLYNKEKFIRNTLDSILAQSFSDFELIIVNDGSTDESEEKVRSFSDPRIHYYSRKNEGVSSARNFGIGVATAEYIAFIDADDYWFPDFLKTMNRTIARFSNQKIFSAAIEIETSGKVFPAQYSIEKNSTPLLVDFFDASLKECVIWTSSAVFQKDVFEKVGVFDTKIPSGQDTDLWIRIGLEFKVVFTSRILARYVFDPQSLSKNRHYTTTKLDFQKFETLEKSQSGLKKYLDYNRYSLAIKSKLNRDEGHFRAFYNAIDFSNLPLRKRILLKFPAPILEMLIKMQRFLAEKGLSRSVFK